MSLEKRIGRLEEMAGDVEEDKEEHVRREALTRVTDEDLELVWEYLKRTEGEPEGEPTPTEWAAIERYFQLQEEVRDEFRAKAN